MLMNVDAEKMLLSSINKLTDANNDFLDKLWHAVQPQDFYDETCRIIYSKVMELYMSDQPCDFVPVCHALPHKIAVAYGMMPIVDYAQAMQFMHYASIIRDLSVRRKIMQAASDIMEMTMNTEVGINDLFATANYRLEEAEPRVITSSGTVRVIDLLPDYLNQLEELARRNKDNPDPVTGIKTHKYHFDLLTNGLQLKDMILVAARPSMGKTAFVVDLLLDVSNNEDTHCLLFSAEMSKDKPMIDRIMANRSMTNSYKLKSGMVNDKELLHINRSTITVSPRFLINDTPGMTLEYVQQETRRLRKQIGPDAKMVIAIDYLQLLHIQSEKLDRYAEVSKISRELKQLAKKQNCVLIALSQLNRNLEGRGDKRPMNSDLRESGQLEQDADVIIFLHRDDYFDKSVNDNTMEVIVSKQRNGNTDTVKMVYLKEQHRFLDLQHP